MSNLNLNEVFSKLDKEVEQQGGRQNFLAESYLMDNYDVGYTEAREMVKKWITSPKVRNQFLTENGK